MNIPKAIEILTEHSHLVRARLNPDLKSAFNLGIEALKEVKRLRSYKAFHVVKLLEGETEGVTGK